MSGKNDKIRGHKFITEEIKKSLPKLYSQENVADPIVVAKWFGQNGWRWFALEWDGEDTFFGLVQGWDTELGYWSMAELEGVIGQFGLPAVERDCHWTPKPLSEVRKSLEEHNYA